MQSVAEISRHSVLSGDLDLPISFCRHRSVPVPRDPLAIAKSLLHGVVHFPLQPSPLSANLQCKAIPLTCPELTAVVRLGSEVRASDSFQIFALTAEEFLGGRDMTGGICLRGGELPAFISGLVSRHDIVTTICTHSHSLQYAIHHVYK